MTSGTSERLNATSERRGSRHYLAPEVYLVDYLAPEGYLGQPVAHYTNKVDIWSLGAILYELWTGNQAYHAMVPSF